MAGLDYGNCADTIVLAFGSKDGIQFRVSAGGYFVWVLSCVGNDDTAFICSGKFRSRTPSGAYLYNVYFGACFMCGLYDRMYKGKMVLAIIRFGVCWGAYFS